MVHMRMSNLRPWYKRGFSMYFWMTYPWFCLFFNSFIISESLDNVLIPLPRDISLGLRIYLLTPIFVRDVQQFFILFNILMQ